jgi:hypothetical protein
MRYPGGKGRSYQRIINLMPPHRVYIETHLGGGAVLRHKRPAQRSIGIERDPLVIRRWRQHPPADMHTEILEGDAVAFLRMFPFEGDELVYSDPPYVRATRRRAHCYRFDYDDEDHVALLTELRRLACPVIVSGYASDLYREFLEGWQTQVFSAASHTGLRTETVWFNFELPERLHDHRFIGDDFRERERMRRRVDRWVARLERMAPVERNALIGAVTERFPPILGDRPADGSDESTRELP